MKRTSLLLVLACASDAAFALQSPNKQLDVTVLVNPSKTLSYSVKRNGQLVLLPSPLGLKLHGADFSRKLKLVDTSPVKAVSEQYAMAVGKRRGIRYRANEQVYSLANVAGHKMDVAFRVSNDGLAFRYVVADPGIAVKRFAGELTGFAFGPNTRFVAGINADQSERTVELDLSFTGKRKGAMITDGAGQREFTRAELEDQALRSFYAKR